MTKSTLNYQEAKNLAQSCMVNSNGVKVHLLTEGRSLAQLGREPMLYLHFCIFTMMYLMVLCAIHVPHLYFFYTSTDTESNVFMRLSIKNWNFKKTGTVNLVLGILEIVSCLVTVAFLRFMHWYIQRENNEANLLSTADFAVHVRDVPALEMNHGVSRIIHYFSSFGQIVQASMALDTGNVSKLKEKREMCIKMIHRCNAREQSCCNILSRIKKIYYMARLKLVNREINRHLAKQCFKCTGDVFIVFNTEMERYRCLHAFNRPLCQRLFTNGAKFAGKHRLRVEPAKEPEDVIWENLEYGTIAKYTRRTSAILVSIFFMAVVAAASAVLEYVRNKYYNCSSCGVSDIIKTKDLKNNVSWASYGISLIVLIATFCLAYVMFFLVSFEKHRFRSHKRLSLTYKLSFASLLVTLSMACVYIKFDRDSGTEGFIPWFTKPYYIPSLVESQLFYYNIFNVVMIAVVTNVVKELLLGPYHWLKRLYNSHTSMTQEELNEAYTPPKYSYPYRYANQLKNIIIALAFSGLSPLLIYIVTAGLFFSYWVDKYNIVYLYRSRLNDEDLLCESAINVLTCGFFVRYILVGITHIYRVLSEDSRNVVSFFVICWIVSTGSFLIYLLLQFSFLGGQSLLKKCLCCMSSYRFPEFVTPGGKMSCVPFHLPSYQPPVRVEEIKRATRLYKAEELKGVQKKINKTAVGNL